MNITLARHVRDFVLRYPFHFDMKKWIDAATNIEGTPEEAWVELFDAMQRNDKPPCGATCCIAGAAVLIGATADGDRELVRDRHFDAPVDSLMVCYDGELPVQRLATDLLELEATESDDGGTPALFLDSMWPRPWVWLMSRSGSDHDTYFRSFCAAALIDQCITLGYVEVMNAQEMEREEAEMMYEHIAAQANTYATLRMEHPGQHATMHYFKALHPSTANYVSK